MLGGAVEVAEPRAAPRHLTRGEGSLARLPQLLLEDGARRILLVTGRRSFEASGAAEALAGLSAVGDVHRHADVSPNPTDGDLATVMEVADSHEPDTVVAVGGGSVLDTAKVMAGLLGSRTAPDAITATVVGGASLDGRSVRLVLVPTTAGSGAEATPFATVYVDAVKHSVAGDAMRADRIVLDPRLLRGSSPGQRAGSGFDAVAQAIESLWAVGGTEASRRDARWALKLLLPAIRPFVAGTGGSEVARRMLVGSHLAGRAIAESRTTAAHALSYSLTSELGLPHGQAVGVTLPALLRAQATATASDLQAGVDPIAHATIVAWILRALGATDGVAGEAALRGLLEDIGLHPLPERWATAITARADEFAARANAERLGNDPLRLDAGRCAAALRAGV